MEYSEVTFAKRITTNIWTCENYRPVHKEVIQWFIISLQLLIASWSRLTHPESRFRLRRGLYTPVGTSVMALSAGTHTRKPSVHRQTYLGEQEVRHIRTHAHMQRESIWGPDANRSAGPAGGTHTSRVKSHSARPVSWCMISLFNSFICLFWIT
jgi:hypothetical protein